MLWQIMRPTVHGVGGSGEETIPSRIVKKRILSLQRRRLPPPPRWRRAPSRRPRGLPSTCARSVSLRFQFRLSLEPSTCFAWSWDQRWSSVASYGATATAYKLFGLSILSAPSHATTFAHQPQGDTPLSVSCLHDSEQ
jgi:hypothetical protein